VGGHKIKLQFNTIIYLKPIQVYYRIFYFVRNRFIGIKDSKKRLPSYNAIVWKNGLNYENSYSNKDESFTFLNLSHSFCDIINWNHDQFGKLWTYNLNYFDFLHQRDMSKDLGISLIINYIKNDAFLKDGKEPYPISIRGMNWVKFLSRNQVKEEVIDATLYNHLYILLDNLEYHILGNHLLENAFAMLFGAYYFQDENLYYKSKEILISELKEQILNDGGHFELSPMYHQIILYKVLDCIQLIKINKWKHDDLLILLEDSASRMISWLNEVTFENGDIPCVNDSTLNIAPTSEELINYADQIGVITKKIVLSDSGYRKFRNNKFELFVDVGNVGPPYQPGHVHSDTLSFILHVKNTPVFVDTGVSTYEKNEKRQTERQTSAHNTVVINDEDQTEVWGGFRVAKRAQIVSLKEGIDFVQAEHDGYKNLGVSHLRRFVIGNSRIQIVDEIINNSSYVQTAYFHLHPSITNLVIDHNKIIIEDNIIVMLTGTNVVIQREMYDFAEGFNNTRQALRIKVSFESNLETDIQL